MKRRYLFPLLGMALTSLPSLASAQGYLAGRPPLSGPLVGPRPGNAVLYRPQQPAPALLPRVARILTDLPQADLALVRANPRQLPLLYLAYQPQLRARFAGVTDEGLALVFSCLVAYQLKPYRAVGEDSPIPANYSLDTLMATPKLMCCEYCYFTCQLFLTFPPAFRSNATVSIVGWDKGTFGNHGQLLATGVGVPLLLDATTGMVAVADLPSLRAGRKVPAIQIRRQGFQWVYNTTYLTNFMMNFSNKVYTATRDGLYPQEVLIEYKTLVLPQAVSLRGSGS